MLRSTLKLTRFGSKWGLAGGTVYVYYKCGLWRGSDETIQNYDKLKKDVQVMYEATPTPFQKWFEYASSATSDNIKPYTKAVGDFRKEWLNFDLSFLTESGDGIIKPTWNRGVSWTLETLKDSPQTLSSWGKTGWHKITEFVNESNNNPSPAETSAKQ